MPLARPNQYLVASVGANWCLNGGSRGSLFETVFRSRSLRRATDVMHHRSCMLSLTVILRYARPPLPTMDGGDCRHGCFRFAARSSNIRETAPRSPGLLSSGCQLDNQGPTGRQGGRSMMTGLEEPVSRHCCQVKHCRVSVFSAEGPRRDHQHINRRTINAVWFRLLGSVAAETYAMTAERGV